MNDLIKWMWLIGVIALCPGITFSQDLTITGRVVDSDTGEPLAYVNVGVPLSTVGTVSDATGMFVLDLKDTGVVSIQYSYVGYTSETVQRRPGSPHDTIRLQPVSLDLPELIVRPTGEAQKLGSLKDRYRSQVNLAIEENPDQNLGSAVGRRFNMKGESVLETVFFYVAANDFDEVTFRVQVMDIRRGHPNAPLHAQPILMTLEPCQRGWIMVDVRSLQITVQKECIVYVEWVGGSEGGHQLSIPLHYPVFGESHYYRYGSQNRWERFKAMATPMQLVVRPVDAQWD